MVETNKFYKRILVIFSFGLLFFIPLTVFSNPSLPMDDIWIECSKYSGDAAVNHWKEAAEAGDAKAQFCLGLAIRPSRVWYGERDKKQVMLDEQRGLKWIRRSAEQGFAPAQIELANAYVSGLYGTKKDQQKAIEWMEKASNQGGLGLTANLMLGTLYSDEKSPQGRMRAYRHTRLWIEILKAKDKQLAREMVQYFGYEHLLKQLADSMTAEEHSEAESWVNSQLIKFSDK